LMDLERENYEAKHGAVTNVQLLNFLFENENFIWLRDISILVAEIDEMFAAKTGLDPQLAEALFNQAQGLFDGSEHHSAFKQKFRVNLDTESKVSAHHERLISLLGREKA
jgi:hypothetical protein